MPIAELLAKVGDAQTPREYWERVAQILSDRAGGAGIRLRYTGLNDSGEVTAGGPSHVGDVEMLTVTDAEGRRVELVMTGAPTGLPIPELRAEIEVANQLAVLVGRRTALERERRLGTFLVELSRWLLAAPETDLLLRYTLMSLTKLVEAQGAYVALRDGDGPLRVATAVGRAEDFKNVTFPIDSSATGRVTRTGQPIVTENLVAEPDTHPNAAALAPDARAAMLAPLQTSHGVIGAVGVIRYLDAGGAEPRPFSLADLHYLTAVAAHIAGGIELSQAVADTRAAAQRAHAMVSGSPLPMALVVPNGTVQQLNEAARTLFGLAAGDAGLDRPLEALGLSPSQITLRLVLAHAQEGTPWHGRVLVTRPDGDRRLCDCTVTDLAGLGSKDLLVALYDRTDELRSQRELIAREKLATVGEIASGVAHEVNNPLTAIRMEAELLSRSHKDAETDAATSLIVREVDRAARIVRSLLRLARRADTTPVRVQINDLVRDVGEIRQRVLKADSVDLVVRLDQAAPAVLGLGQELQQVVINLVTNAEHAVRGRTPAVIQLQTAARAGWVRLTVEDSGPGVPREIRQRIFDPFFTTKGPDEGSGLGLAICQRVVSEVGGKLWLEDSEELGGARFVVELPAAPERVETEGMIG
jgi:signal transduction histidine kinase